MTRTSRCSRRKTESCRVMRGARALFIEYISECAPKKAVWFLVGCDGYARYSKMRQIYNPSPAPQELPLHKGALRSALEYL